MQQVRKAGVHFVALAMMAIFGLFLMGTPGTAAQRGGDPAPPEAFETLCVNVHTQVVRAPAGGSCQSHQTVVNVNEDLPLALCVNEFTSLARFVDAFPDCGTRENPVEVTGFEDFSICVNKFTDVVRVPDPFACQGSEIDGILRSVIGPDAYESLPNVGIDVPVEGGLLANDAPIVEIVSADATTGQGGDVVLELDGSFTYDPPAGFIGVDTLTYVARIGENETEVTAEIAVEGPVIWFVDNTDAADGEGRLSNPFGRIDLVNDDGTDPDKPGDVIYLFTGVFNYSGGLALEDGQMFIGECLDLVETANVDVPQFSVSLPDVPDPKTGCEPFLHNDDGNVVDLAPDTFLGGMSLAFGNHGLAGADFTGDVDIREVRVTQVGANALDLVNIDGTISIEQATLEGSDGNAAEDGGDGIFAESVRAVVIDRSVIRAGDGGDSGVEDVPAGAGGIGIRLTEASVQLTNSSAFGGVGGEQLINGSGGNGGDGIRAEIESGVRLDEATSVGGDGGSTLQDFGGNGGRGLLVSDESTAAISNSELIGGTGARATVGDSGAGGDGLLIDSAGEVSIVDSNLLGRPGAGTGFGTAGFGGHGLSVFESEFVSVTGSSLTGGAGGANEGGDGADGGFGLTSRSTPVSVHSSVLTAAAGGTGLVVNGVDGEAIGVSIVSAIPPVFLDVQNNDLEGVNDSPSLNVFSYDSEVCLNAVGNSDGNGGAPEGRFVLDANVDNATLAITQASFEELAEDNNGATIDTADNVLTGCGQR